jgi:Na+/H+ antiporter NhaD/arsenite permease-like protein
VIEDTTSESAHGFAARLKAEWLLLVFAMLAIVLAVADPQPVASYRHWLQLPTLAGLLGLLVAIQGIRDSGWVQHMAVAMTTKMRSLRSLGLLLVVATASLSMVLTNDVSLFLIVPLTLAIGAITKLPVARAVVLEALAVNAGSTLSPIGNPQNLMLWQHSQLSFVQFSWAMLPASAVMLALVASLTWVWLPTEPVTFAHTTIDNAPVRGRIGIGSLAALLGMVLMIEYGHAPLAALALLLLYACMARSSLARVDWLLLLTFAAIFLGLGHFAELPWIRHALHSFDFRQPLTAYVAGIGASQLISNVPATVLLLDRTPDVLALAVAVNVGGAGLVTGSLANLIALRLAKQPKSLRLFHLASIPFLLVSAPLVYVVWQAVHG